VVAHPDGRLASCSRPCRLGEIYVLQLVTRLAYTASIVNAATFNPTTGEIEFGDMNAFREAGGKLLIWHGWADAVQKVLNATLTFWTYTLVCTSAPSRGIGGPEGEVIVSKPPEAVSGLESRYVL